MTEQLSFPLKSTALLLAVEKSLGHQPTWTVEFSHPGPPISKSRARWARKGGRMTTYTPGKTVASQDALAWRWKMATKGITRDEGLSVACVFYRQNLQRIDVDNLVKLVLDAGTQASVWRDDCQVVSIVARVELDAKSPRTEVTMSPSCSSLERRTLQNLTCTQCGNGFVQRTAGRQNSGLFCSGACAASSRRVFVVCPCCGKQFKRNRETTKYCSKSCSSKMTAGVAISEGKRLGRKKCEKCDNLLYHRSHILCSQCRGRGRPRKSVDAIMDRVANLISSGLCLQCGKESSVAGRRLCVGCRGRANEANRKYKQKIANQQAALEKGIE